MHGAGHKLTGFATVISAILLSLAYSAGAADYYVDAARPDDSGVGTSWAAAKKTIAAALALASPTRVYVKDGTYNITAAIEIKSGCELLGGYVGNGAPGDRGVTPWTNCTVNAGLNCRVFVVSNCFVGTKIEGFTITGGSIAGHGGGLFISRSTNTISRNRIIENRTHNNHNYNGAGIYAYQSSLYLSNNIIATNSASWGMATYGGGIYCQWSDTIMVNNTVHGNRAGYVGGIFLERGAHTLKNNIVSENLYSGIRANLATVTLSNNCVWGNSNAANHSNYYNLNPGATDISLNPYLAGSGDYHLQSRFGSWHGGTWSADVNHSPCIDAGDPADPVGAEPAPNGGRINMGAFGGSVEASKSYTPGAAAPRYVRPLTDSWTPEAPYTNWAMAASNIQDAVNAAEEGDFVYVKSGTYMITNGHIVMRSVNLFGGYEGSGSPGARSALPAENCILEGGKTSRLFYAYGCSAGATIDGFAIQNGAASNNGAGVYAYMSEFTFANNMFLTNRTTANSYGGAVMLDWGCSAVFDHNVFAHNNANYGGQGRGGAVYACGETIFLNNTMVSNSAGYAGTVYCNYGTHVFSNNIVALSLGGYLDYGIIYLNSGNFYADYNNSWGHNCAGYAGVASAGPNDISDNPCFANFSDGHLQSRSGSWHGGAWTPDINHSPCIDAGPPDWDVGDEPAPNGSRINMGAYAGRATASKSYTPSPAARYVRPQSETWTPVFPYTNWDTAAETLQAAIDAAEEGDPVYVKSGTYLITDGQITMRTVRLMGGYEGTGSPGPRAESPAADCILDAKGSNRVFYCEGCEAGTLIDGFTIKGGKPSSSTDKNGGGLYFTTDASTLSNCRIISNKTYAAQHTYGGGIYLEPRCSTRITRNIIAFNEIANGLYGAGGGICALCNPPLPSGGVVIDNNMIYTNKGGYATAGQYATMSGGGIFSYSATVINNTIYGNYTYEPVELSIGGVSAILSRLTNNIIVNNSRDGLLSYRSTGDYNCVWGNTGNNYTNCDAAYTNCAPGVHDINADPLFAGAATNDFRLRRSSPCVNAGTPLGLTNDFFGNRRPLMGAFDIGAHECEPRKGCVMISK